MKRIALIAKVALGKRSVHLILIALLGLLAYSNTFNVPFQLDENKFIGENPFVISPQKLFSQAAKDLPLYEAARNRAVGYLTFAINYRLHGLDVMGYHIVNLAIHLVSALLVYRLVLLTFNTPLIRPFPDTGGFDDNRVALYAALFFVAHPVQTEAVTYIFQRFASLVTMFYLLSLVMYIRWRMPDTGHAKHEKNIWHHASYILSIACALLAMKTKENAFTLPLIITLYEVMFFKSSLRARITMLAPFLLTLFIIPLANFGAASAANEIRGLVMPDFAGDFRWTYFITQIKVIAAYLRLLILPVNQNLYYDYPPFSSFGDIRILLPLLLIAFIWGAGAYLLIRSRAHAALRIISFGIFWFFITISVESSVIPLPSLINEYRIYLPSVGFFIVVATSLSLLAASAKGKYLKLFNFAAIAAILILTGCAYKRNAVWSDRITLWSDVASKSPRLPVAHYNLGKAYQDGGDVASARRHYETALGLKPDYAEASANLGVIYAAGGHIDEAVEYYLIAVRLNPELVEPHFNLGVIFLQRGQLVEAQREMQAVLRLKPEHVQARSFLAHMSEEGRRN